jgi:NADPH2:quinone reductase
MEQGACLGIPGITAHRALHVAGPVDGCIVLVHGGAGAVGVCAVQLARRAGAIVVATVRSRQDEAIAMAAGAHDALQAGPDLVESVRAVAPAGIAHVIDVAFAANIHTNLELLMPGGSIAAYATDVADPAIPFWPLLFKNTRLFFVGSDDVPAAERISAARALNEALEAGWQGFQIAERFSLDVIADAHEWIEGPSRRGRVVIVP